MVHIAEYSDLTILSGEYTDDVIFVTHGCPELTRSEYVEGSGDLEEFHIGDYHELHLTMQNVHNIESINPMPENSEEFAYFSEVVNLFTR